MPYQHIEEIQSRRGEKIAMFLTMENAMGLILGALPTYILTGGLPFLFRMPIILVAALMGIAVTLDLGGMAGYERLLWRVRGFIRIRTQRPVITPEQLTGAASSIRHNRPLPVGGPIQLLLPPRAKHPRGNTTPTLSIPESHHARTL